MTRGRWGVVVGGVVLIAVAVWLIAKPFTSGRGQGAPAAKGADHGHEGEVLKLTPEQRQALGVVVEPAEARVPEILLHVTGKIAANPDRTVAITSRAPGRFVTVQAALGDTVEAGATLALVDSLEAADALGDLAQAESALALAQARAEQERQLHEAKLRVLESARRQVTAEAALRELAQVELGRAKQEYISAVAKAEAAQADYEREQRLIEAKVGARKDLVRAEKELLAARAEREAVAETIRLGAKRELLEAETALQQARAQRDKAKDKARVLGIGDGAAAGPRALPGQRPLVPLVAPFKGTVIERQASEGQLLDAAAVPFRLADLSVVWALLDVPEAEAAAVRSGQEVLIEAAGNAPLKHAGRVVYVGAVVEEATRTVKVRVEIPNPARHFRPGMFVTARITTRRDGPPVVMVPRDAVVLLDEGPVVFVEQGETIAPRPVDVGPEADGWVPVRKGLTPGERVVTGGAFALKAQLVKAKLGEE